IENHTRSQSITALRFPHVQSLSPPELNIGDLRSRTCRNSKVLACTTERHSLSRNCAPVRKSSLSAEAIRPGRPPCFSRTHRQSSSYFGNGYFRSGSGGLV